MPSKYERVRRLAAEADRLIRLTVQLHGEYDKFVTDVQDVLKSDGELHPRGVESLQCALGSYSDIRDTLADWISGARTLSAERRAKLVLELLTGRIPTGE